MKNLLSKSLLLAALLFMGMQNAFSQSEFKHWPKGTSPKEVGKRISEHFVESPHANSRPPDPIVHIIYPEVCTWYGALSFAKLTNDKTLATQLERRFDPLWTTEAKLLPLPVHVDNNVFGTIPLELFLQTGNKKYLDLGLSYADTQWKAPDSTKSPEALANQAKGLTWQTRMWIDDAFMITEVQTQASRATGDPKYMARAAKEMVAYLDQLQRPNGLFFHAPDVPFFWGRGNGWMAAGMSELLRDLPKDNPDRPRILQGYQTMMASLLKYQAENGMWHQLIDDPSSWYETSCTGMFTFAMITGVKNGWLDKKTYAPAARKGWLALITYINEKGDIREVCEGTNKKNDHQYYLDRRRNIGDMHGQAPILWCASAFLR